MGWRTPQFIAVLFEINGCLSLIIHQGGWRHFTKPQAWAGFDGNCLPCGRPTRLDPMVITEVFQDLWPILQAASLVGADPYDPFADRLIVKEGIELDHSVYIRQWDMQGSGNFGCNLFGKPAINFLGRMQGWQQPRAAQMDIRLDGRLDGNKVKFRHWFSEEEV